MPNWNVMESKTRYNHPSRKRFYKFLRDKFGTQKFKFLDVGIISLVDYKRLHNEYPELNFHFVGVDLYEKVIKLAREEIDNEDDLFMWDIHNSPPKEIGTGYNVALMKHMLSYCSSYSVILNIAKVMANPGYIFIVNNKNIFSRKDKIVKIEKHKVGIGKYGSLFSEKKYLTFLKSHFKDVSHKTLKDCVKPYTVTIIKVNK